MNPPPPRDSGRFCDGHVDLCERVVRIEEGQKTGFDSVSKDLADIRDLLAKKGGLSVKALVAAIVGMLGMVGLAFGVVSPQVLTAMINLLKALGGAS